MSGTASNARTGGTGPLGRFIRQLFGAPTKAAVSYPKAKDYVAACILCVIAYRLDVTTCLHCHADTVLIQKKKEHTMKPLFDTGKPATKTAAAKPLKADVGPTTSHTIHVEARPWSNKPKGLKNWVGTGSALVRADVAAGSMREDGYHASFDKEVNAEDEKVLSLIREVTEHKPVPFGLSGTLNKKHAHGDTQVSVELSIFTADDQQDRRLVFVESSLLDNIDKLWVVSADYVHPDGKFPNGYAIRAVNAKDLDDITFLVAPYKVDEGRPLYRRALRKIGRKS